MIMGYARPHPPMLRHPHRETWHIRYGVQVGTTGQRTGITVGVSNGNGLAGSIPGFTPGNIATALRLLLPKLARALKPIGTGSWLKNRKERSTSASTTAKREPTSGPNAREKKLSTAKSRPQ
jgi:hypothetical protein